MKRGIPIFVIMWLLGVIVCHAEIITVDDDSPADFNNIQAAIDDSNDGDTIEVQPGIYRGEGNRDIDFLGKTITVRSTDPDDPCVVSATIIDCNDTGSGFEFFSGEGEDSVLSGLTITNAATSAILCYDLDTTGPTIRNCLITSNRTSLMGGGIAIWNQSSPTISNCIISNNFADIEGGAIAEESGSFSLIHVNNCVITGNESGMGGAFFAQHENSLLVVNNCIISGNRAKTGGAFCIIGADVIISNSILWGNTPYEIYHQTVGLFKFGELTVSYSNVEGGFEGIEGTTDEVYWLTGNMDSDPCFAEPGYWDANGTPADANDDFWVGGDYHLQSEVGRWDPNGESWITDVNTSLCIDAGDPCSDWTSELWPHGKHINMGTYGGTTEASMSTSSVGNIANLDNDVNDFVDVKDLAVFVEKWLCEEFLLAEDLNRNGFVNFFDFDIFADNWLQ